MGWFKRAPEDDFDTQPKRHPKIRGIKRRTLELIMEASKDSYENGHEFAAVLRARKDVIHELLMLPDGGNRGKTSVMVYLHMLPIDLSIVGSVHSHPSSNYYPSNADLDFFGRAGMVNIIVAYPYTDRSWQAYNRSGERIILDIIG